MENLKQENNFQNPINGIERSEFAHGYLPFFEPRNPINGIESFTNFMYSSTVVWWNPINGIERISPAEISQYSSE